VSAFAPLKRRFLSLIYEALILTALLMAVTLLVSFVTQRWELVYARYTLRAVLVVACGVFYVAQWRGPGQTLPMKTWKMQLRLADGASLGLRPAVLRFIAAFAGTCALGVGFWWAFFDRDRQFLHDRLCGTRLVQA
jgi:uncharacterized RDD family membrane protein YckC